MRQLHTHHLRWCMDISHLHKRIDFYLWLVLRQMQLIDWHWLQIYEMSLINFLNYLRKGWQRAHQDGSYFSIGRFVYLSTKGLHIVHKNANTLEIRNWVLTKSYLRWVSNHINCCYLKDVDYTMYSIVIYSLMQLRLPLFDLIKLRLKVIMRNILLILYLMSNLIIGREGEVLIYNFWLTSYLLIFLNGCYLSKLMIVNNCLFSKHREVECFIFG